jgi:NAD+ diphosphatase
MAVLHGNQVLLAKNAQGNFPFWSLLAGYVESGESLEQAVIREVHEESGLIVDRLHYVGSQPWPYSQSLMAGFICHVSGGELKIDYTELSEAEWFDLDNLPEIPPPPSMAGLILVKLQNDKLLRQ